MLLLVDGLSEANISGEKRAHIRNSLCLWLQASPQHLQSHCHCLVARDFFPSICFSHYLTAYSSLTMQVKQMLHSTRNTCLLSVYPPQVLSPSHCLTLSLFKPLRSAVRSFCPTSLPHPHTHTHAHALTHTLTHTHALNRA